MSENNERNCPMMKHLAWAMNRSVEAPLKMALIGIAELGDSTGAIPEHTLYDLADFCGISRGDIMPVINDLLRMKLVLTTDDHCFKLAMA